MGRGVEVSVDDIGREHVLGVGVRVAEEVGERDGGEGVVIAEGAFVEFHHYEVCFGAVGTIVGDVSRDNLVDCSMKEGELASVGLTLPSREAWLNCEPHFDTVGESDRFGKPYSPLSIYVNSDRAFIASHP